ncbi:hypothetical protein B9Z55_009605 [Caenorhabditis nigoni]|uniref:Uncharacterized protein n=1 Tax=Caenorhabditis nigoni TaxID=1611254 RepID=A0A2G5USP5_9PELO|nr:hypothetical protein B9Z55_009605 [Caenorhabditis nigoni]
MFYWQGNIIKGAAWCSGRINFEDFYFQDFNNFYDSLGCFQNWQDMDSIGRGSGIRASLCIRDRATSRTSSDVFRIGMIWNQLAELAEWNERKRSLVLGWINFEDFEDSWSHLNPDGRSLKFSELLGDDFEQFEGSYRGGLQDRKEWTNPNDKE